MDEMTQAIVVEKPGPDDRIYDRYLGAFLGAAIADALGWITEFRKSKKELEGLGVERVEKFLTWEKPTGGRFHTYRDFVSQGEYSDDTQLTLCTARSLEPDGTFNPDYFERELTAWLDYARGAGAAITAGARNLSTGSRAKWNDNFYTSRGRGRRRGYVEAGGNGAAMRVMPHGLANRQDPIRTAEGVWQNAITTHGHPRAIVGALAIAEAARVLASADTRTLTPRQFVSHISEFVESIEVPSHQGWGEWVRKWQAESHSPFADLLDQTKLEMVSMLKLAADTRIPLDRAMEQLGCFKPATKGSGTACVAAALGAFIREPLDYARQVLHLVNLLGIDTDTIGSMYGALVGLRIGSTRIPDIWSTRMQDYDYFLDVADVVTQIGVRKAKQNYLRVDTPMVKSREHNLVELAKRRTVSKGQRVLHELLGPGWVQAVHSSSVKSGGLMLLADVAFDTGQSARFKSFKSPEARSGRGREGPTRSGPNPGGQGQLL